MAIIAGELPRCETMDSRVSERNLMGHGDTDHRSQTLETYVMGLHKYLHHGSSDLRDIICMPAQGSCVTS